MTTTRTRKTAGGTAEVSIPDPAPGAKASVVPGPDYVKPEVEPKPEPQPPKPPRRRQPRRRRALTTEQVGVLMAPLNPNRVATRSVGGRDLSYVEAWDIKATLTRIFGFGGWSEESEAKIIDIRDGGRQGQYTSGEKAGQDKTPYVMAQATVKLIIHNIGPNGQDVFFQESAIGTNDGWTIGDVADNAIKSAASDALKRCAISLGTQFGLSLYNNGSRTDVVRVILEPEQKELLAQHRADVVARRNPERAEQIAHSLNADEEPLRNTVNVVENVP